MAKAKKQEPAEKPATKKTAAAQQPAASKSGGTTKEATSKATASKAGPSKAGAARETTAKKAGPEKKTLKTGKSGGGGTSPQAPLIDTGLAAAAAAAMVANLGAAGLGSATQGDAPAKQQTTGGQPQESSSFKNLKQSINKPIGSLGGILGSGGGHKQLNQGFGGTKPSVPGGAKNQTFGADVNRAGVPRRTGG